MKLSPRTVALLVCFLALCTGRQTFRAAENGLPAAWQAAWRNPSSTDRPLQIVHGVDPQRASVEGMRYYQDLGLGGVVANVAFDQYLQSEQHWQTLQAAVAACRQLGLVVWIYDEDGYPSGAAGGRVLAENPDYEALVLVYDAERSGPYALRRAYEFTHATGNYYAARRYINLLDDRATACFLRKTHAAYAERLASHFGSTITTFFTDEPSLMSLPVQPLPEKIRGRIRVVDRPDPQVKPLPMIPWSYDLPDRYRERYGGDLVAHRSSLFTGDSPEDRRARRQFWSLVADLVTDRYYGQIQRWCADHQVASSGHKLAEENLMGHVPLEGNGLQVLRAMQIPGLDMLSSDPMAAVRSGWLTALLPSSAALLEGRRRVMTEVSDFSQTMAGQDPASVRQMQATAAWQAAWGVTDFTLYYRPPERSADDYRAYTDFVGRLNAILKPADCNPHVLLYYPIVDLWEEYRPTADVDVLAAQSPRARRIVSSFMQLGQLLAKNQIPFCLADDRALAEATVDASGRLMTAGHSFAALILPDQAALPAAAAKNLEQFRAGGGQLLQLGATDPSAEQLLSIVQPHFRLNPPSDRIVLGSFVRDGRPVLLLVNVGSAPYRGLVRGVPAGACWSLAPASGAIEPLAADPQSGTPLELAPHETVVWVGGP